MKVLVSSKALAKKLSEIDFDNDSVYNVVLNPVGNTTTCELSINTTKYSVKILVESIIFKAAVIQEHRRWDAIRDLVNKADDQPIVLEINERVTNVIFQY